VRGIAKISCTGSSYLLYELLFVAGGNMQEDAIGHYQLLVGLFRRQSTYSLATVGLAGKIQS
jgi:hypothetical protein